MGGGGGILIYVREDIPCKLLDNHISPGDIEGLFVELNFRKSKLLLLLLPITLQARMIITISKLSEMPWKCITQNMKKIFLAGEVSEDDVTNFRGIYGLKRLVHERTCYKSVENPSCIDLLLTNYSKSFQKTRVISSSISDFHKIIVTAVKITFPKAKPRQIYF